MTNLIYDIGVFDERDLVIFPVPKKAVKAFKQLMDNEYYFVGEGNVKGLKKINPLKLIKRCLSPIYTERYFHKFWKEQQIQKEEFKKLYVNTTGGYGAAWIMNEEEYVKAALIDQELKIKVNKRIQKLIDLL